MAVPATSRVTIFAHAYKTQATRRVAFEYVSFANVLQACAIFGAPETRATKTFRSSR